MKVRWLVLAVVVLVAAGAAGTSVALFASRRHLTVSDLLHARHHHGPGAYPDSVRDAYAQSCRSTSGGDTAVCACVYNRMAQRYTLAEFQRLERVVDLGLPDEVKLMVSDCRAAA